MTGLTYAELIRVGSGKLRDAGLSDPVREARQLMLLASDFAAADLISAEMDIADPDHHAAFNMFISMREDRHPVAHITGWAPFYGLRLRSDSRALIPRADSEPVVDLALEQIATGTAWQIADLGTGTGALLAAVLMARPESSGTAIDLSAAALSLAAENFAHLNLSGRAELFSGSWADWTGWSTCDLIISNPPYIRTAVLETLAPEVRDHDPNMALDGGPDGLIAYREIIALAARQMHTGAHLVLEIGYDQKAAVTPLLQTAGFATIQHRQDLGGNDRAIAATKT